MHELKEQMLEHFRQLGVALVGVADVGRFEGVRPNEDPREIFPEARSVIVLGMAITRGTLRGQEEGTNRGIYRDFGSHGMEEFFLPNATYHAVRFLEDAGWEAVPIFPHPAETQPQGVAVADDRVAPNVIPDIRYAAVAAGLGEIGRCGLLLTPRYGPLQQLAMIVTDAEIEPDPLFDGLICDQCEECLQQCPHGALSAETVKITVAGKTMLLSELEVSKCLSCGSGEIRNPYNPDGEPDRIAAACGRACLAHLDEIGALELKYKAPFRKRQPWFPGGDS